MLKLFLKTIFFTIVFSLLLSILTLGVLGWYGYTQYQKFSQAGNTNWAELKKTWQQGWNEPVIATNSYKNILILGTDSLPTRGEVPPLSDTLILVSLSLKDGQIRLLSLPRDLWSDIYQTKINTLLAYGKEKNQQHPEKFSQDVISNMIGLPIHHTVVLSMDQVSSLIDLVGGVEVDIKEGFIDEQFPRTDVDIKTEHDPAKLYERIEFVPGKELMNGERALKFMRSRHSDGDQGTDIARSIRQQQVILALVNKIQQPRVIANPDTLGHLYSYYFSNFDQYFSLSQAIATIKNLWPIRQQLIANLKINTQSLSIYPEDNQGAITHPKTNPAKYQKQWVYAITDDVLFQNEIKSKLNP